MTMSEFQKLRTPTGGWVSPEELHDVLAEEGYSGTERKTFLKSLLTELAADSAHSSTIEGANRALLEEVRSILETEQAKQGNVPMAKDEL
ncbi:hypothetical protein SAMN05444398_12125 [Roseovarius pacificus]|uniref:Uncharacterized protein n=1 Tax=Roseovarius pacificus TaxID=337701 RepID=A0A1M7JP75_9RHOB|nr:hypothetical protein [Roseovarius pacificus]GGO58543.1 hypothetical protein GCM10011315_28360 [Roseovarius pacificus]SHM54347.1 hypothetical protein SAMN05444398_12125 [Roseovarius pacificus]